MYRESLTVQVSAEHPFFVTYYLTEENGRFGVECVIDGKDSGKNSRCEVTEMTAEFDVAEHVLELMARGNGMSVRRHGRGGRLFRSIIYGLRPGPGSGQAMYIALF